MSSSKFIIGTAQLDKNYGFKKKNFSSLSKLLANNNFGIDTSPEYLKSDNFFKNLNNPKLKIVSKLPAIYLPFNAFKKKFKEQLDLIFKSVEPNKVDTILIHDPILPLDKNKWKVVHKKLNFLKKNKKINKIGISVYSKKELNKILKVFIPDVVQFPLNIFNKSFGDKKYLNFLKKKKIELHARSIFLQGLLLLKKKYLPKYFNNWKSHFDLWYKFLQREKIDPFDYCLNFVLSFKSIDKFVLGFDNDKQFKEFLNFINNYKSKKFKKNLFFIKDENLTDPRFWPKNKNYTLGSFHKKWIDANNVILSGNMLLSKKPNRFLKGGWPTYFSKAKGCNIWDLNKKKYLDFSLMGVGTNILGYANNRINNKIKKIIDESNMSTLNSYEEVILSKKLLSINKWADKCFFAKTGGEANTIAIRIARTYVKKNKIAVCGYHGWHDWYLSANLKNKNNLNEIHLSGLETKGIPDNLKGLTLPFKYNDIGSFESLIKNNHDIGIVFMEVQRNEKPKNKFLEKIRNITRKKKIVLIFDECTSGFRENLGGLHKKYKIIPDICVYGKAIGNGIPLTAIVGKNEIMESAKSTFISSTFWTDRLGFVASIATIEEMERIKSWTKITNIGKRIKSFWKKISNKYQIPLRISGLDSMPTFEFLHHNNDYFKSYLIQEMLKYNIIATNTVYCSISHLKYLNYYFKSFEKIFSKIKKIENNGSILKHLDYPIKDEGFERLN